MADERPQGGNDKRWLYAGLAAGGIAFVYVWWKNRGGSGSSSATDGSAAAVDSAGGSGAPTDMRDVIQVNYASSPATREDNQPTTDHDPKPKRKAA